MNRRKFLLTLPLALAGVRDSRIANAPLLSWDIETPLRADGVYSLHRNGLLYAEGFIHHIWKDGNWNPPLPPGYDAFFFD